MSRLPPVGGRAAGGAGGVMRRLVRVLAAIVVRQNLEQGKCAGHW